MRQLASLLLVVFALPLPALEAWRWKDEKGVFHYSDTQVPGAERVTLPSPPPRPTPAAPFRYSECVVTAPGNDQTFNAVNSVTVAVRISPPLQSNDRIQLLLDQDVYAAWPARSLTFKLDNVNRGTHTLAVTVIDAGGKSLCTGPSISFHVRQPSLLSPARPRPPAP